jgi:hypothetical protein
VNSLTLEKSHVANTRSRELLSEAAQKARNEYMRSWRKNNREKVNQYQAKYRANNPDKVREWNKKQWERVANRG